jgi:hypothetical protein
LAIAGQTIGLTLHSGPSGIAFATNRPSHETAKIASAFGPAFQFFQLGAPEPNSLLDSEQRAIWHDAEPIGDDFYRWTREATIVWRLPVDILQPCRLTLMIPLQNEVQPRFADLCRIEVGDRSVACGRANGALTATLTLEKETAAVVRLTTPRPLRPRDLGGVDDNRSLGLAIFTI